MTEQGTVYVFFAAGHPWHFADSLTRFLSRSHFSHVMAGDARGVYDPTTGGDRIIDFDKAWLKYPTLQTLLAVPCKSPVDPRSWPKSSKPTRFVPSLLRFLTRTSRIPVDDCVQRAAKYIRACGVAVPPIYHAWELYAHLQPLATSEHVADDFHPILARERRRVDRVAQAQIPASGIQPRNAGGPARRTHPPREIARGG